MVWRGQRGPSAAQTLVERGEALDGRAGPGAESAGRRIAERGQASRDRLRRDLVDHPAVVARAYDLRAPGARAADHGHPGGERLEMHVAERLVAGGQRDHVGRRVEALDLRHGPGPDHAVVEAEPGGEAAMARDVALAGHDQTTARIGQPREALEQRTQPLALEARSDEEHRPRLLRDTEALARALAVSRAVVGMEALEVDPVIDERDRRGRGAVQPLDLGLALPRDRHHVPRRAQPEDAALEGADEAVVGIDPRAAAHRGQVRAMASLARAVEILAERTLVALHEIVALARGLALGGEREREEPQRGGMAQDRHPADRYARHVGLASRADQLDGVPFAPERPEQSRGGGLDAAVERERPADQGDLHGSARRPGRERRARTRSTSGNS